MGIVPLGIGITVIGFLWGAPFNEFGSPPLLFRFFGSFIALAFVMIGAGILFGKMPSRHNRVFDQIADAARRQQEQEEDREPGSSPGKYACPRCGAPLADGADVSPHGDVKCTFCTTWFNVHGK
jgi:hypothetical protein